MHTPPRAAERVVHPGGMNASRVMPTGTRDHLDPFVVFERFYIEPEQGFPTHPHRGFEIVSYMLEGSMAHTDSLGTDSLAREGDAMRVTTGSGIRHAEMPGEGAACNGLQLWINLPRAEKNAEPGYEDATADELPTRETEGATVTTVVGEGSPLSLRTPVSYEVARLDGEWTWRVPDGWNGFAYAIDGEGTAGEEPISGGDFLAVEGGGEVTFAGEGLRVACIAGRPHGEPIRQRGPFVE